MSSLADRILQIRRRITVACERVDRDPAEVTIVGVSKTVGRAEIDAAYAAGLRDFGENRVQDALAKFSGDWPSDATRHYIGSLQTNKVAQAVTVTDLLHSVDRPSLIDELCKRAGNSNRIVPLLLQVNIAGEMQKNGCEPEVAFELATSIIASPALELRGLMTMAPLVQDPEDVRPVFAALRELRDQLQESLTYPLPHLSMGMTNDYDIAVQEGATLVRIGRAIFVPDQV